MVVLVWLISGSALLLDDDLFYESNCVEELV